MDSRRQAILGLLHREVKPALGCTEPIAVALAVAKAVEIIQENCCKLCPEGWRLTADLHIDVAVSGNILKNGMGVGIPGTGMVGLPIAAALGAVCGDSSRNLEVLSGLNGEAISRAKELVARKAVRISVADTERLLYVIIELIRSGSETENRLVLKHSPCRHPAIQSFHIGGIGRNIAHGLDVFHQIAGRRIHFVFGKLPHQIRSPQYA